MQSGQIGQSFEQGNLQLTVVALEQNSSIYGSFALEDGGSYLLVTLDLRNTTSTLLPLDPDDFALADSSGQSFTRIVVDGAQFSDPAWQWPATLAPESQHRGILVFEGPAPTEGLRLRYQPAGEATPPLDIALDDSAASAAPADPAATAAPTAATDDAPEAFVPTSQSAGSEQGEQQEQQPQQEQPEPDAQNDIGRRFEQGGAAFTVLDIALRDEQANLAAGAGETLVVVDILLENLSDEALTTAALAFELIDAAGHSSYSSETDSPDDLAIHLLPPGEQAEGFVVFVVDAAASQQLRLRYAPLELTLHGIEPFQAVLRDTAAPPPTTEGGRATVAHGGNLRSGPQTTTTQVLAQVCPADQLAILAQQGDWYHVRVMDTAADCVPERAAVTSEGWLHASLLAQP
jgi:hypothetical protein